ncbi:MAG: shikimate dehydrogenase [Acidimicrobiales bacterium]
MTRLAAVIGSPVALSLSPALHNSAFRATGLDWTYVALEVAWGAAASAVEGMRALRGFDGMSVTVPHKLAVAEALGRLSATAEALGAVNTIVRDADGELSGHNTDGEGFLRSLADVGFEPEGRSCLLVGAGGAARAVAWALAGAGAEEVVVVNRTPERAVLLAALAGPAGRVGRAEEAGDADLVVNATPLGMSGRTVDPLPVDPSHLRAGQVVLDLVYDPAVSPLLEAAAARGAHAINGLGMLVHQAAAQFALWTGQPAPLEAMFAAVRPSTDR